jgi:hypothetical protein
MLKLTQASAAPPVSHRSRFTVCTWWHPVALHCCSLNRRLTNACSTCQLLGVCLVKPQRQGPAGLSEAPGMQRHHAASWRRRRTTCRCLQPHDPASQSAASDPRRQGDPSKQHRRNVPPASRGALQSSSCLVLQSVKLNVSAAKSLARDVEECLLLCSSKHHALNGTSAIAMKMQLPSAPRGFSEPARQETMHEPYPAFCVAGHWRQS